MAPPRTVAATTVALSGGRRILCCRCRRVSECGGLDAACADGAADRAVRRVPRGAAAAGGEHPAAADRDGRAVVPPRRGRRERGVLGGLRRGGATTGLSEAAAELRLPSSLVVAYVPLLQPTVTSVVALLVESSRGADVAIGLLGVLLRRPFGAVAQCAAASGKDAATEGVVCRRVAAALLSKRHRWRDGVRAALSAPTCPLRS